MALWPVRRRTDHMPVARSGYPSRQAFLTRFPAALVPAHVHPLTLPPPTNTPRPGVNSWPLSTLVRAPAPIFLLCATFLPVASARDVPVWHRDDDNTPSSRMRLSTKHAPNRPGSVYKVRPGGGDCRPRPLPRVARRYAREKKGRRKKGIGKSLPWTGARRSGNTLFHLDLRNRWTRVHPSPN